MKYWTRTTHNFNNDTREWEYRKELDENKDVYKEQSIVGIHALDSGRWMSLVEVIEANRRYYEQFKDDPYSATRGRERGFGEQAVLADLDNFERLGFVKSKEV